MRLGIMLSILLVILTGFNVYETRKTTTALTECRADLEAQQGVWHTVECEVETCELLFAMECPTGEWCRIVDGKVEMLPKATASLGTDDIEEQIRKTEQMLSQVIEERRALWQHNRDLGLRWNESTREWTHDLNDPPKELTFEECFRVCVGRGEQIKEWTRGAGVDSCVCEALP